MDNPPKATHRIKTFASTSLYQKSANLLVNHRQGSASLRNRISEVDSSIAKSKRAANSFRRYNHIQRSLSNRKDQQISLKPLIFSIVGHCNNEKLILRLLEERDRWIRGNGKSRGQVKFIWGYLNSLTLTRIKDTVVMSRIFGSKQMTQKGNLYQNISSYCQKKEMDLNFLPITFYLNRESPTHILKSNIKDFLQFFTFVKQNTTLSNAWIMKPTDMNQGRDIQLFQSLQQLINILNDRKYQNLQHYLGGQLKCKLFPEKVLEEYISNNRSLILQKYIQNPLLINSHKFDIRIWVCIDHLNNFYVFQEGYLRFSSQPYELNSKSISDQYMHLTNHALQKHSPTYETNQCLQPIAVLKKFLKEKGKERFFKLIFQKINQIIQITIKACIPANRPQKHKSFQLFGFDFLIDRQLNVRLIEANCNPALTQDNELLSQLIPRMLNDLFKLTIDKIFNTRNIRQYHIDRLSSQNGWIMLGNLKNT